MSRCFTTQISRCGVKMCRTNWIMNDQSSALDFEGGDNSEPLGSFYYGSLSIMNK